MTARKPAATRLGSARAAASSALGVAKASPSGHRLDPVDEVGVLGAVLVPDRLHRALERGLVGNADDLDPGLLHLREGFLLLGEPELPLLELRLAAELGDQLLVVLRQRVPGAA